MLIAFMGIAKGVAEERHANFAHDSEFQQPGVECVAQVVKSDVPNACSSDRSLPSGL